MNYEILDILEIWYAKAYAAVLCAHHDETPRDSDTVHSEPLIIEKACDEDSVLNTDNDDMSFDTNANAFDLIKEYRLKNTNKLFLLIWT